MYNPTATRTTLARNGTRQPQERNDCSSSNTSTTTTPRVERTIPPRDEAHEERGKGEEGADEWIGARKKQPRKHQRGSDPVQKKVVPLDGRADRRRGHGTHQHLAPHGGVGQRGLGLRDHDGV